MMNVLRSLSRMQSHASSFSALRAGCLFPRGVIAYSSEDTAKPIEDEEVKLPGRKSVYEPVYLDDLKPKIPLVGVINIQLKGYDFVVLEKLQRIVHRLCNSMDIEVTDGYALRAESWRVQRFVPRSSKSEAEFQLKEYQRVLQMEQIPTTKLSILVEVLQAVLPAGVTCQIVKHTEELEKLRFIPDMGIKALQEQLEELGGPSKHTLLKDKK